jgi:excisionase family DNA binding protein
VARVSEPWLSADDLATHLGVTKDSVYAWIAKKGMPAHKVGRLWRFQASEVDVWVRRGGGHAGSQAEDVSQATRGDASGN